MDGAFLGNPRDFGAEIVAFDEEGNEVRRVSIYGARAERPGRV